MRIVAVLCLALLAGCADSEDQRLIAEAEAALRGNLKDAASAQIRKSTVRVTYLDMRVVCGEVNAKNGFGGYTGFSPYVYSRPEIFIADDSDGLRITRIVCENDRKAIQETPFLERTFQARKSLEGPRH